MELEPIDPRWRKTTSWSPQEKMLHVAEVSGWATDQACIVLQVDLGLLRFVTAVGTQGAISKETRRKYYVKTYRVDISSNGEDWITIKEGNKPVVSLPFSSTNAVFDKDDQFSLVCLGACSLAWLIFELI